MKKIINYFKATLKYKIVSIVTFLMGLSMLPLAKGGDCTGIALLWLISVICLFAKD